VVLITIVLIASSPALFSVAVPQRVWKALESPQEEYEFERETYNALEVIPEQSKDYIHSNTSRYALQSRDEHAADAITPSELSWIRSLRDDPQVIVGELEPPFKNPAEFERRVALEIGIAGSYYALIIGNEAYADMLDAINRYVRLLDRPSRTLLAGGGNEPVADGGDCVFVRQ